MISAFERWRVSRGQPAAAPRLFSGVALCWVAIQLAMTPLIVHADATLGGTRVVFQERRHEASITITNTTASPYVIQAWIDSGDDKSRMTSKPELFVSPPLFRLDGGKENVLRIIRGTGALPSDRETVFWLNAKEIPVETHDESALQIAIRSRIKVFYRPEGIEGSSSDAPAKLRWTLERHSNAINPLLHIHNSSAFHVTFSSLTVDDGVRQVEVNANMIPPGGDLIAELSEIDPSREVHATFQTLTDFGGETRATTVPLE